MVAYKESRGAEHDAYLKEEKEGGKVLDLVAADAWGDFQVCWQTLRWRIQHARWQ